MHWTDTVEKVARILLWLALAAASVVIPLAYIDAHHVEERFRAAVQKAEEQRAAEAAAEKARKPGRLGQGGDGHVPAGA
jgi:peptidoglycan/LPS O-acetylase OafA/YrhL